MLTEEQIEEIRSRHYFLTYDFNIDCDFTISYVRYIDSGRNTVYIEVHEMPYPVADLIRSWGYKLPIF